MEQIQERKEIALAEVVSSQIAAIGHDTESDTLAIQLAPKKNGTPGSIYYYSNFQITDLELFMAAESLGSYFYKMIKPFPEKFPYVKIS